MKKEVFISYSSKNSEIAHHICEVLELEGIPCWIAPRDITPGKEWGEQIIEGIEGSRILVLIFSAYSNESSQVLREVERAISKKLTVIAFRIEDVLPTKSMEYFLYSNHWLDAFNQDRDTKVKELVLTVRKILVNSPDEHKQWIDPGHARSGYSTHPKKIFKGILTVIVMMGIGAIAINLNAIRLKLSEEQLATVEPIVSKQETLQVNGSERESLPAISTETTQMPLKGEESVGDPKLPTEQPREDVATPIDEPTYTAPVQGSQVTKQENEPPVQEEKPKDEVIVPTVQIGQCVKFGLYNHEPIVWQIIDVDSSGNPLLLTTNIVTLKSFDAAESGKYNNSADGNKFDPQKEKALIYTDYTSAQLREMKGSNNWSNSNIREWLNSSAKNVGYSTAAPTGEAVSGGLNDYSKEPGFLAYFSEEEKAAIMPVSHKSLLADQDKGRKVGGSEPYKFSRTEIGGSLYNYSNAYYEKVEDKVFLLSVEEVLTYIVDRGWDAKVGLTAGAIENDKSGWYKDLKGQTNGYHMWWLRTPDGKSPSEICCVGVKGDSIYSEFTAQAGVGVRPALKLNLKGKSLVGNGLLEDPFVLN